MNTPSEHPARTRSLDVATRARQLVRSVRPVHLTGLAWSGGFVLFSIARDMDICSDGFPVHTLNAFFAAVMLVQLAALLFAVVRYSAKQPGSGKALAGAIAAGLLALPGALMLFLAIDFDLCLSGDVIM